MHADSLYRKHWLRVDTHTHTLSGQPNCRHWPNRVIDIHCEGNDWTQLCKMTFHLWCRMASALTIVSAHKWNFIFISFFLRFALATSLSTHFISILVSIYFHCLLLAIVNVMRAGRLQTHITYYRERERVQITISHFLFSHLLLMFAETLAKSAFGVVAVAVCRSILIWHRQKERERIAHIRFAWHMCDGECDGARVKSSFQFSLVCVIMRGIGCWMVQTHRLFLWLLHHSEHWMLNECTHMNGLAGSSARLCVWNIRAF